MSDSDNPMGTDGFEFVEYTAPDTARLAGLFDAMGFVPVARHRSKDVTLWRQGDINFVVNGESESFAQSFARVHGPSVCAIGLRVADAAAALARAVAMGARAVQGRVGPMELNIPAIEGIGGSLIYLVDRYGAAGSIWDVDFRALANPGAAEGAAGLLAVDHLTHNVHRGRMHVWTDFYERIFGFRELRSFEIEGRHTGLHSRALVSPCGKIRIPINESADDRSQIAEYLAAYRGEGIQHIALSSNAITASVETLASRGMSFLAPPPDAYYAALDGRLPGHDEDVAALRRLGILIDGEPDGGRLLQIFTGTVIGPIFFEIIQRKGNDGFGEGNFRALFEVMEQDQIDRGRLVI